MTTQAFCVTHHLTPFPPIPPPSLPPFPHRIVLSSICRSFTFSLRNQDNFVDSDHFLTMKAIDVNLNITKRA